MNVLKGYGKLARKKVSSVKSVLNSEICSTCWEFSVGFGDPNTMASITCCLPHFIPI